MSETLLMSPLTLRSGVIIKNRLLKSAMSEAMADSDHHPNQRYEHLYKVFAQGGTGLVVTGNVMIDRTALGEPGNVVLDEHSDFDAFKRWANAGTVNQTALWMQLNHPGKQSPRFLSKTPVAPSAVPLQGSYRRFFNPPRALTLEEIKHLIKQFAYAAQKAKDTGFSGVQIHAAHGYLISQFLSPRQNQRQDLYGGSEENRQRFLLDIYHAMREVVGKEFPIGVKLNSQDFEPDGFDEAASLNVIRALDKAGIDLIEISGGNYEKPVMSTGQTSENDVFFLPFASKIRPHIQAPLVITGGFRSVDVMEEALKQHEPAMIGLGRPLALDPNIPLKIQRGDYQTMKIERLTTGFKSLDKKFGPILGNSYYEQQLRRLAEGKAVKRTRNAWGPILKTAWDHGPKSLFRRSQK